MVLRYAITSRALFSGDDRQQQAALLGQTARWAADGIDLIQLREKDLPAGTLVDLARKMMKEIGLACRTTKLLINSRADIAIAAGADGVHLTAASGEVSPAQIRDLFAAVNRILPIV